MDADNDVVSLSETIELPPGKAIEIKIPGTDQVLRIPARERTTLMYVDFKVELNEIIGDSVTQTGFSWLMHDQKMNAIQRDLLANLLSSGGSLDTQTLFERCWKERWNAKNPKHRRKFKKAISDLKTAINEHPGSRLRPHAHPPFGIVDIVRVPRGPKNAERMKLVFDWDGDGKVED